MSTLEQALLANYDQKIVLVLLCGDSHGKCDLSEDFIVSLVDFAAQTPVKEWPILFAISNNWEFYTAQLWDHVFATKQMEIIKQFLFSSRGIEMESRHIIALLELGNKELIDFYFCRHASVVFCADVFEPVMQYMRTNGLYEEIHGRYFPKRQFT
ncbi:MAG: hypothetical protein IJ864_04530 [Alphaproteobacteria bacterium]|nr:hypothetical protein [Alphaproteobacteria bacterium]